MAPKRKAAEPEELIQKAAKLIKDVKVVYDQLKALDLPTKTDLTRFAQDQEQKMKELLDAKLDGLNPGAAQDSEEPEEPDKAKAKAKAKAWAKGKVVALRCVPLPAACPCPFRNAPDSQARPCSLVCAGQRRRPSTPSTSRSTWPSRWRTSSPTPSCAPSSRRTAPC